jgi:hypothetical protein
MKWALLPTNIFWIVGHIVMFAVGIFSTVIAGQSAHKDILLGVGGSLIAAGIAGEILFLYVAASQQTRDKLDLISIANTEKLLQARLLFMRHGYELKHFRGRKEPYDEDYQLGTVGLLNRAVEQVKAEFGVRSIFFVEDTSVRIEGLDLISGAPEKLRLQSSKSLSELHRSLRALLTIGIAATCEEISELTAELGLSVRKYNTNRALKEVPEFAHRLEQKGERLRYQPTERSLSLLRLLDLLTSSEQGQSKQ